MDSRTGVVISGEEDDRETRRRKHKEWMVQRDREDGAKGAAAAPPAKDSMKP